MLCIALALHSLCSRCQNSTILRLLFTTVWKMAMLRSHSPRGSEIVRWNQLQDLLQLLTILIWTLSWIQNFTGAAFLYTELLVNHISLEDEPQAEGLNMKAANWWWWGHKLTGLIQYETQCTQWFIDRQWPDITWSQRQRRKPSRVAAFRNGTVVYAGSPTMTNTNNTDERTYASMKWMVLSEWINQWICDRWWK